MIIGVFCFWDVYVGLGPVLPFPDGFFLFSYTFLYDNDGNMIVWPR